MTLLKENSANDLQLQLSIKIILQITCTISHAEQKITEHPENAKSAKDKKFLHM